MCRKPLADQQIALEDAVGQQGDDLQPQRPAAAVGDLERLAQAFHKCSE